MAPEDESNVCPVAGAEFGRVNVLPLHIGTTHALAVSIAVCKHKDALRGHLTVCEHKVTYAARHSSQPLLFFVPKPIFV